MNKEGSRLKILKAEYGDSFVLEVKKEDHQFVMVIDGGPKPAYCAVNPELLNLTNEGQIDIMVLTHFDHDHIYGLWQFLENNKDRIERIKKFWVNLPERVIVPDQSPEMTYDEAKNLRTFFEELEKDKRIIIDWRDSLAVKEIEGEIKKEPIYSNELVKIYLLAPSEADLQKNEQCFRKKVGEDSSVDFSGTVDNQICLPLEECWEKEWRDSTPINDASMAMLIEAYDGRKFLMCGDANPETIENSLRGMKYCEENPLKVDVFKLSHHGSRCNVRNTLLDIVDADCYLISTNGGWAATKHPNRETIAKLLLHPNRNKEKECRICFNYDLNRIRDHSGVIITDEEIKENKYNFSIKENVHLL